MIFNEEFPVNFAERNQSGHKFDRFDRIHYTDSLSPRKKTKAIFNKQNTSPSLQYCSLHAFSSRNSILFKSLLCVFWFFSFKLQLVEVCYDKVIRQFAPKLTEYDTPRTIKPKNANENVSDVIFTQLPKFTDEQQSIHIKVSYESINHRVPAKDEIIAVEKGQTLLTSFFHRAKRPNRIDSEQSVLLGVDEVPERKFSDTTDIAEYLPDPLEDTDDDLSDSRSSSAQLLRLRKQIHRKYRRFVKQKFIQRTKICTNLTRVARSARYTFSNIWHEFHKNLLIQFVYKCIIVYHQLCGALVRRLQNDNRDMQQNVNEKLLNTEAIMINRRVQRLLSDKEQPADDGGGGTAVHTSAADPMNKRLPKSQRVNDSTKLLLNENGHDSPEKDFCKFRLK